MSTTTGQIARPSPAWRKGILPVPLLAAAAAACFAAFVSLSNGHAAHQAASCRWLPLSWTIYATAYGSVALPIAAVVLYAAMVRHAKRNGQDVAAVWQGQLALPGVAVAVLAVLAGTVAVVLTHLEAADIASRIGTQLCEG